MYLYNTTPRKSLRRVLRKNTTDAEQKLWFRLRRKQLGVIFHRQHSIGPYVVDFYCPHHHLVIELDGGQHNDANNVQYDNKRTNYLNHLNIKVLRFWNDEVLKQTDTVVEVIYRELPNDAHSTAPLPPPNLGGGIHFPSPRLGEGQGGVGAGNAI